MSVAQASWGRQQTFCAESDQIPLVVDGLTARLTADGWTVEALPSEPGDEAPTTFAATAPNGGVLQVIIRRAPITTLHLPDEHHLVAMASGTDTDTSAALDRWIERLPFTDAELSRVREEMPLTTSILEQLPRWAPDSISSGARPLGGFGGIFTIHHQTDFVILLERAIDLGADPDLITVIDKQYRYRSSSRVDATITDRMNIPVFTFDQLEAGEAIRDHLRRVKKKMDDTKAATWQRTVIVDDGGYVLPRIMRDFEQYMNLFVGVVEQTASGIWALQPYEADLRVPVFSVAESDLKQTVEAHGVAMAAVVNLRNLLPNIKFTGQRAIVVGYGRIGKALAEVLRSMRLQVVVVDLERGARVGAAEDGFETALSVVEAIRARQPKFVLSCAGRDGVSSEAFDALRGKTYLASCTSRDYAFDKAYLKTHYAAEPYGSFGTIYRSADSELFLVADGYPVNFHHAESMPNAQSDLVMASMLLGAVHLCTAQPSWPAGNDSARANFHINSGTLLDDFYELHHEVMP